MTTATRTVVLLLPLAATAAACASLSGGAKTQFASDFSCPPDRLAVAEIRKPPGPAVDVPPPPPEVRADPERLAYYQEEAKRRDEEAEANRDALTYYEVEGCGHRAVYGCRHPIDSDGEVTGKVSCASEGPR